MLNDNNKYQLVAKIWQSEEENSSEMSEVTSLKQTSIPDEDDSLETFHTYIFQELVRAFSPLEHNKATPRQVEMMEDQRKCRITQIKEKAVWLLLFYYAGQQDLANIDKIFRENFNDILSGNYFDCKPIMSSEYAKNSLNIIITQAKYDVIHDQRQITNLINKLAGIDEYEDLLKQVDLAKGELAEVRNAIIQKNDISQKYCLINSKALKSQAEKVQLEVEKYLNSTNFKSNQSAIFTAENSEKLIANINVEIQTIIHHLRLGEKILKELEIFTGNPELIAELTKNDQELRYILQTQNQRFQDMNKLDLEIQKQKWLKEKAIQNIEKLKARMLANDKNTEFRYLAKNKLIAEIEKLKLINPNVINLSFEIDDLQKEELNLNNELDKKQGELAKIDCEIKSLEVIANELRNNLNTYIQQLEKIEKNIRLFEDQYILSCAKWLEIYDTINCSSELREYSFELENELDLGNSSTTKADGKPNINGVKIEMDTKKKGLLHAYSKALGIFNGLNSDQKWSSTIMSGKTKI